MKNLITMALCYDFDGTLAPGNMQEYGFIDSLGATPEEFWTRVERTADAHKADRISTYMYRMAEESREKGLPLREKDLNGYGHRIQLFPGVEQWFGRINEYARKKGVLMKHYVISSGLREIIDGTSIAGNFSNIFASSFMYGADGEACWPASVINYTTKTQYLFRINKGCEDITDDKAVNSFYDADGRPVPFKNMIYIGDGETDVPCMSILGRNGGHSIAVYPPGREAERDKISHLETDGRADIIAPADYSNGTDVDCFVKDVINKIASECRLRDAAR
jgi:phosphoserine phosphatase